MQDECGDETSWSRFEGIWSPDGRVLDLNTAFKRLHGFGTDDSFRGRGVGDLFPADYAAAQLKLIRCCCERQEAFAVATTYRGHRMLLFFEPCTTEDPDSGEVVAAVRTSAAMHGGDPPESLVERSVRVMREDRHDYGPLAVLSRREVEVLRLICEGLPMQQIARRLHRSERTVQFHRVQIGKKLGGSNLVELARIGIAAGLLTIPLDRVGDAVR